MRLLIRTGRIVTGMLFIFSGFVKGIDPLGTAYKLSDYFSIIKPGLFDDLSLPASVALCTIEFVTGLMLVTGAHIRIASWAAALFMGFFTPLTLYLALFNPVSDCGCFGDAVHLSNWQTFFKNIIITLMVVFIFIKRNDRDATMRKGKSTAASVVYTLGFLLFLGYNLLYLPVIDFRPYKPGTNLPEAMSVPPDAPTDKYDIGFIYEKGGVKKEFTLADYPADDTTWHFVDQVSVLVSKGYEPPVHDFVLLTGDGYDMTDEILNDSGFTILMISDKLEGAYKKGLTRGFNLGKAAQQNNVGFFVVTSTLPEEANAMNGGFTTLYSDETTLKTVIRSNPGFILLQKGTVLASWSHRGLPENDEFSADLNSLAIQNHYARSIMLILSVSALIILIVVISTAPFRKPEEKS